MDVNTDFACKFATLLLAFALVFIYVQHITAKYDSEEYKSTRLDPVLLENG